MQNIKLARLESDLKEALMEISFRLGYSNIVVEHIIFSKLQDHITVEITSQNNNIIHWLKVLKDEVKSFKYYLPKYISLRKVPEIKFVEFKKQQELNRIEELFAKISEE